MLRYELRTAALTPSAIYAIWFRIYVSEIAYFKIHQKKFMLEAKLLYEAES